MDRTEKISPRGKSLIIATSILIFIATTSVIIRLIGRFFILETSGKDDWCALAALFTSTGFLITIALGATYGIGSPESSKYIDDDEIGQIRLAAQALYISSSGLIKLSIAFLYRRIFPNLRILTAVTITVVPLISIAFIFSAIFQCKPVGRLWTPSLNGSVSCDATLIFWCDVSVCFLITDIWVTILPLRSTLRLQLPLSKRLIFVIFLSAAGLMACVAAAVRLAFVVILYKGQNISWDVVPIYYASVVEISVALFAMTVPTNKALVELGIQRIHGREKSSVPSDSV